MDHKGVTGLGAQCLAWGEQVVPVGMGGESLEVDDAALTAIPRRRASPTWPSQQGPAQTALGLIAQKTMAHPQRHRLCFEVVTDPARVAHTGGRDDDLWKLCPY